MMSFSPRGVARHSEQLCSVMTQRDSVPARVRRARVPRDTNTTAARFEGVDISTDGQPGPEETRWVFLPKTQEWFSHDADGNLLTDGKWVYTSDGENRLIAMETSSSLPSTLPPVRLEFLYDSMSIARTTDIRPTRRVGPPDAQTDIGIRIRNRGGRR
jgi:hypothetical protein